MAEIAGITALQSLDLLIRDEKTDIIILMSKPPAPSVAEWPVIGKKVYETWGQAAKDLPKLLKKLRPQLESFAKGALELAAGMAGGLLQFLLSMIFAGIMLAYGQSGSAAILTIINRLAGHKKGASLHKLSTATIRSVAMGVVGVSTIQALIFGVGFIFIGLPGAAIVALIILVLVLLNYRLLSLQFQRLLISGGVVIPLR